MWCNPFSEPLEGADMNITRMTATEWETRMDDWIVRQSHRRLHRSVPQTQMERADKTSDSQQTREIRGIQHPKYSIQEGNRWFDDITSDRIDRPHRPKFNAARHPIFSKSLGETRNQASKVFDPRRLKVSSSFDLTRKMVSFWKRWHRVRVESGPVF